MPFTIPDSNDPLRTLVQLYGLKQSQDQAAQQDAQDKLTTGLRILSAGGDLSGVDPSVQQQLAPIADAVKQQNEDRLAQFGISTLAPPIISAIQPRPDAQGNLTQPAPADIEKMLSQVEQSLPPRAAQAVRGYISTATAGAGAAAQERVAAERRATAQDIYKSQQDKLFELQAQKNVEDQKAFSTGAAQILAVDPTQRDSLLANATQRWGPDVGRSLLATSDVTAKGELAKQLGTIQPVLQDMVASGQKPDPTLATEVVKNNAYKDPLVGMYVRGSQENLFDATTWSGLYRNIIEMNAAAQKFAETAGPSGGKGGNAFTGPINKLAQVSGGMENPYYAQYIALKEQNKAILSNARKHRTLSEPVAQSFEQTLPEEAQLNLKNGQLDQAAKQRLFAFQRTVENEYLGRFPATIQAQARNNMQTQGNQFRDEFLTAFDQSVGGPPATPVAGGGYTGGQSHADQLFGNLSESPQAGP